MLNKSFQNRCNQLLMDRSHDRKQASPVPETHPQDHQDIHISDWSLSMQGLSHSQPPNHLVQITNQLTELILMFLKIVKLYMETLLLLLQMIQEALTWIRSLFWSPSSSILHFHVKVKNKLILYGTWMKMRMRTWMHPIPIASLSAQLIEAME